MFVFLCETFFLWHISDETKASLQNANTISYTTSTSEQIDNAKLVEKANVSSGDLDANENDKETKSDVGTPETEKTTPVEADLNNGPFTEES